MCDLFVLVEQKEFNLHKAIMAASMKDYIEAHERTGMHMTANGTGTSPDNRIEVQILGGAEVFEQVVLFCYGDENLNVSLGNACGLYYAAKYFQMPGGGGSLLHLVGKMLGELKRSKNVGDLCSLYGGARELEQKYSHPDDFSKSILPLLFSASSKCSTLLLPCQHGFHCGNQSCEQGCTQQSIAFTRNRYGYYAPYNGSSGKAARKSKIVVDGHEINVTICPHDGVFCDHSACISPGPTGPKYEVLDAKNLVKSILNNISIDEYFCKEVVSSLLTYYSESKVHRKNSSKDNSVLIQQKKKKPKRISD